MPEMQEAALCAPDESPDFFYIIKADGQFEKYDTELNLLSDETYFPFSGFYSYSEDIDGDNKGELIFRSRDGEQLIISENDFSSYSFANIAGLEGIRNFSLKLNGRKPRELALFTDTEELILVYLSNNLYYLQYPVYSGIYVVVLLFILLIQKTQRHIAEQKYEAEKKIAEWQLKAIKNQIDPHFTLNIINSIGSLFYKQEREKADYLFGKYSKFLRTTILNSDKIITTLQDELDHVENYLVLEKFRNDGKLNWQFDLDKNVNMEIKIPKMLIHTFVENAMKHGLRNLEKDGMLSISMSASDNEHVIVVRDNGIGRAGALKLSTFGTGKGMQILDQILELYYNLMKVRITYTINDLYNDEKESAGTEIAIIIPKQ